jgi:hypothetical protein
MAFVKVVGGSEIYNFRIQRFVYFYSKFWSFSGLNTGTSTRCRPVHRRAATSCAPRPSAGCLDVRAHTPTKPRAFPMCPRPEAPRSLPRATRTTVRAVPARCAPRTAGPSTALRRMCADQGRRTTVASPPSPRRHPRDIALINTARPPPPRVDTAAPPRHQRRRRRAASPLLPTVEQPSLPLP